MELVLADMLPTLLVLSVLPSVRLRLSQRLKLLFFMEDMSIEVFDILDSAMQIIIKSFDKAIFKGLTNSTTYLVAL